MNVFDNPNATVGELVDALLHFERTQCEVEEQMDSVDAELVQLHQWAIMGSADPKRMKTTQARHAELSFQLKACMDARPRLVERMMERLPLEAEEELERLGTEDKAVLDQERRELVGRFVVAAAKANALWEEIHDRRGKGWHRDFDFVYSFMCDNECLTQFEDAVKRERKTFDAETNRARRDALGKLMEQHRNAMYEPHEALKHILRKAGAGTPVPPREASPMVYDDPATSPAREVPDVASQVGAELWMGYREYPVPGEQKAAAGESAS